MSLRKYLIAHLEQMSVTGNSQREFPSKNFSFGEILFSNERAFAHD